MNADDGFKNIDIFINNIYLNVEPEILYKIVDIIQITEIMQKKPIPKGNNISNLI